MTIKQKDIDRAAMALLFGGKLPSHKVPSYTKADLERKFVIRVGRGGKPSMEEVK